MELSVAAIICDCENCKNHANALGVFDTEGRALTGVRIYSDEQLNQLRQMALPKIINAAKKNSRKLTRKMIIENKFDELKSEIRELKDKVQELSDMLIFLLKSDEVIKAVMETSKLIKK